MKCTGWGCSSVVEHWHSMQGHSTWSPVLPTTNKNQKTGRERQHGWASRGLTATWIRYMHLHTNILRYMCVHESTYASCRNTVMRNTMIASALGILFSSFFTAVYSTYILHWTGDWMQSLIYAKHTLYHWAISHFHLSINIFLFGSTGVRTQGLVFARQAILPLEPRLHHFLF
jgi:hypothetical protein